MAFKIKKKKKKKFYNTIQTERYQFILINFKCLFIKCNSKTRNKIKNNLYLCRLVYFSDNSPANLPEIFKIKTFGIE